MSQTSPFFSVIIPSFNRADELKELLSSLQNQDYSKTSFEIIVSDDGSSDNTPNVIKDFQRIAVLPILYINQKNQGPGAARNHGMQKATGEFFVFVDSDVTMASSWLSCIHEKIKEQNADAFGGPDTYREDFPSLLKAINYSMTSFITTGGLRGRKGKKLAKFYPRSFNMGLSRDLWKKIGGFGSLRHGQDIEFSHRILKSEAKVVFVDDAPVYHKRRTNLWRFYKQVFNWGIARINLYKIDKTMLEPLHAIPAIIALFLILILMAAVFSQTVLTLLKILIALAILVLLLSIVDSIRIYKSIFPALWLPLVMPAQILGYGLGFLYNFGRRVVLKKGKKTGFKKNYYK